MTDLYSEIVNEITLIRIKYPMLRICQIMHNAVATADKRLHGQDHFFVTDDVLLDGLKQMREQMGL